MTEHHPEGRYVWRVLDVVFLIAAVTCVAAIVGLYVMGAVVLFLIVFTETGGDLGRMGGLVLGLLPLTLTYAPIAALYFLYHVAGRRLNRPPGKPAWVPRVTRMSLLSYLALFVLLSAIIVFIAFLDAHAEGRLALVSLER